MLLLRQSILMSRRSWPNKWKALFLVLSYHGYVKETYPKQNHPKLNNPKDYFDIAKSSTDSSSTKKDNCSAITNLLKICKMKTYDAQQSRSFYLVSVLATTMQSVDIWALQKLTIKQNVSAFGPVSLTGSVHSLLVVWLGRTINLSLNLEMEYHCKSKQDVSIPNDP